ncbi:MAG: Uma2 family endonuclease [Pseudomonadota bacterium]|nr:Uma2 family endonuclease [Pseudomonadota bacterium]
MGKVGFESEGHSGTRRATYADLEAVPDHLVAEIIGGELVTHPRPAPKHIKAATSLGIELGDAFERGRSGPGGWVFFDEPELHLCQEVIVPDLAGWRIDRLRVLPDKAYFETAPDWVCEVLSPSTERLDRGRKRRTYAQAGVSHYWLLDPRLEILETFVLTNGEWLVGRTYEEGDKVAAPPFDAIAFPLSILWPLKTVAETAKDDN